MISFFDSSSFRKSRLGWLLATGLVLWSGLFFFFSRHLDFPIDYHPDERSKGEQIISGKLNFHHPMLLLQGAELVLRLDGAERSVENAVRAGRVASAAFAALAVVFLSVFAGRRAGWFAAAAVAILLPLHPLLYELAHYAKEDTALLLGISFTLLMLDIFLTSSATSTAMWVGAAAGVALSGKYVGLAMLLLCAPVIWQKTRSLRVCGAFALAFLLSVLLINLPCWLHLRQLVGAIQYEMNAVHLGGAKGLSRDIPHGKYLGVFLENTGWPLRIGLAFFIVAGAVQRRKWAYSEMLLVLFPLGYAVVLSFSPKTAERYFLIASPWLITAGWLGWAKMMEKLPTRGQFPATLPVFLAAAFVQWQTTRPMIAGFSHDSRKEMSAWAVKSLPPGSVAVAETRARFSVPAIQLATAGFLPDLGALDELEKRGIRYLVVTRTSFGGYLDPRRKPSKDQALQHQQRATFYRTLFERGKLLKKTGGVDPAILNPEIRLYDLEGT